MKTQSATIAGAGPAGLSAALALSRAGWDVEVHEARKTVGAKFFGGLQMIDDFSEEEPLTSFLSRSGVESDFLLRSVTRAELFDSRLRRFPVQSEEPFGHFVTRGPDGATLDASLLRQTLAAGARVNFESRVDGAASTIVATGPKVPDGIAQELTFETSLPDRTRVLFDARRAPGGYAYLFVVDGRATFGCALVRDLKNIGRHFDQCLDRFREIEEFTISNERTGASYMTFAGSGRAPMTARLAGEAGGFQDYLFGLGIRYAIETGLLAAESVMTGRPYDDLWRARVGKKRDQSLAARFLYEAFGNAGLSIFVRRAARSDFRRYLRGWTRPGPGKGTVAALARILWKNRGSCAHEFPSHWCRSKESH